MKNIFIAVIILLVSWLVTGCGVSQSQYDAVSLELNKAKQDQQSTQTQLQKAQTDLITTQTQLQKAQADLITTQTQLQKAQADLITTQTQRQKAQADLITVQTQLQTTQSELAKTKTDLQTTQAQVQSLQKDQGAAAQKRLEASNYAELLGISMYEVWIAGGINPGFTFLAKPDWIAAMTNKATSMGDANLVNYIGQLDSGGKAAYYQLWYYCFSWITQDLK
jgi:peptidoglycan hydrolase CwlO-like protein